MATDHTVTELVVLLREGEAAASPPSPPADPLGPQSQTMDALVDELWSAQYLAPGALCAFAGDAVGLTGPLPALVRPTASHGLALRFPAPPAAASFVAHPAFAAPADAAVAAGLLAAPPTILAFTTRSPDESLEALFRRGAEWEDGLEVCLVFAPVPGPEEGQGATPACSPDAFTSDLAALAESSLAGALQACPGRLVTPPSSGLPPGASHALLARFARADQAEAFLSLPPLVAAAGGPDAAAAAGSPLLLVGLEAWSIAPAAGAAQPPPMGAPR